MPIWLPPGLVITKMYPLALDLRAVRKSNRSSSFAYSWHFEQTSFRHVVRLEPTVAQFRAALFSFISEVL